MPSTSDYNALATRRHPKYQAKIDHWKFCIDTYRGDRDWLKDNIFKFHKEGEIEFKHRLERTHRANHTKRVVSLINEYLFKQGAIRKESAAPPTVQGFWKKATLSGKNIDALMVDIDVWSAVTGFAYVVVDRPADQPRQKKEETLPYAYIVLPDKVWDMGYDKRTGDLAWILIQEDSRDDSDPFAEDNTDCLVRLWTTMEWQLFRIKNESGGKITVEKIKDGKHDLGLVPVIPVPTEMGARYCSNGLVDDVVYMDRSVANYGALLDEMLYEQTFSQLTLPAESLKPGEDSGIINAAKERIFTYLTTAGGGKPEFISPDASQARLIMDARSDLVREIYAVTGTDYEGNSSSMSTGKSYASGKVRQFDFQSIENLLAAKSRVLEFVEERLMEIVLAWMGEKNQKVDAKWVEYPTKFDIRGLEAELEIASKLYQIESPVEVMRAQMHIIAKKAFPRMDEAGRKQIEANIDGWTPGYKLDRAMKDKEFGLSERQVDITEETAKAQAEAAKIAAKNPPKPPPNA